MNKCVGRNLAIKYSYFVRYSIKNSLSFAWYVCFVASLALFFDLSLFSPFKFVKYFASTHMQFFSPLSMNWCIHMPFICRRSAFEFEVLFSSFTSIRHSHWKWKRHRSSSTRLSILKHFNRQLQQCYLLELTHLTSTFRLLWNGTMSSINSKERKMNTVA